MTPLNYYYFYVSINYPSANLVNYYFDIYNPSSTNSAAMHLTATNTAAFTGTGTILTANTNLYISGYNHNFNGWCGYMQDLQVAPGLYYGTGYDFYFGGGFIRILYIKSLLIKFFTKQHL